MLGDRHLTVSVEIAPGLQVNTLARCAKRPDAGVQRAPADRRILSSIAELLGSEDHLLLGADLVKDPAVISAAYNDPAGVTAEFNLNMLAVINRELGADFNPGNFEHVARYDLGHEWIEMRLRAQADCTVHTPLLDLDVSFAAGEEMRTEISAKFTPERIAADLQASGLTLVDRYSEAAELYSLVLAKRLRPAPTDGATHTGRRNLPRLEPQLRPG